MDNRIRNSINSLISLYTVVIGVAMSSSIIGLIQRDKGLLSVDLPSILLFIAFVITLFPFYHGALRHLDDAYVENGTDNIKDGALMFDFMLLFVHALTFVILSMLLKNPTHFAWCLIILLSVDVVWGIFSHFASSSEGEHNAEWKWTIINAVFVVFSLLGMLYFNVGLAPLPADKINFFTLLILVACGFRTAFDYGWGWKFYFPER